MPDTAASMQAFRALSLKCTFKPACILSRAPPLFFVAESSFTSFVCLYLGRESTKRLFKEKSQPAPGERVATLHWLENRPSPPKSQPSCVHRRKGVSKINRGRVN